MAAETLFVMAMLCAPTVITQFSGGLQKRVYSLLDADIRTEHIAIDPHSVIFHSDAGPEYLTLVDCGNLGGQPVAFTSFATILSGTSTPPPTLVPSISMGQQSRILDHFQRLHEQIAAYAALPEGWDGEEAPAPTTDQIRTAEHLIEKLPSGLPVPSPMISTSGLIGLYWDDGKIFADIEIEEDGSYSFFSKRRDGTTPEVFAEGLDINEQADSQLAMLWRDAFDYGAGSRKSVFGVVQSSRSG